MVGKFKVAAVQVAAGQIDGPVGDLDELESLTSQAAKQGARLVVWPECAYPAYFLRSKAHYQQTRGKRLKFAQVLERLAAIARGCGVYLVAGLVEERDDGGLSNGAMLFDPRGRRLLTYRKCFLWHFDNEYFTPGDDLPVIDTELGRIGVMICADGRCPELAAIAGLARVQLLVNPTAWVSWGREPSHLTSPQIEFFIPARAMETGCWIVSANKVGVEADSVVYCGRSNVVNPRGERIASLDSQSPGVLVAEVDLGACRPAIEPPTPGGEQSGSTVNPSDRFGGSPGRYPPILFAPTMTLPVRQAQPVAAAGLDWLVAGVVSGPLGRLDPQVLLADLATQSANLVVVPGLNCPDELRQRLVAAASASGIILCFANGRPPGHGVGRMSLAGGTVESFVPARQACLNGAELFLADAAADGRCADLRILRTRAAENRMYVAAAAEDRAVMIDPGGGILADSLAGRPMAVVCRLTPAWARDKLMAPGTDVVASRNTELFARLLREREPGRPIEVVR